MKVLHISNHRNKGGGTALARQLASCDPDNSPMLFLERSKRRFGPEGWPAEYGCDAWDFAFISRVVRQIVVEDGCIILHAHGRRPGLWAQLLRALYPRRIRVVFSFHGIASFAPLKTKFVALQQSLLSLFVDQYIAAGRAEVELFRHLPMAAPIALIPNSFNENSVMPWTPRPIRRVGFCARFEYPKLHEYLIRVVAAHNESQIDAVTLVVAGDGSLREKTDALGRQILGDEYRSLGHVDHIRDFYGQIDAFAHFSRFEGMPLALLDAQACGMPCVATDVIGCRDIVEDKVSGRLVPIDDIPAAARILADLTQNPSEAIRLASNARLRAVRVFSPDILWRRHAAIYDQLRRDLESFL